MKEMKEITIYKRDFQHTGPDGKGMVYATAQLASIAKQKPYFSLTETEGCANHKRILEAMPELQIFADLHLAGQDGVPMHAVANAAHHLGRRDMKAAASTLGTQEKHLRERWGAEILDQIMHYLNDLDGGIKDEAEQAIDRLEVLAKRISREELKEATDTLAGVFYHRIFSYLVDVQGDIHELVGMEPLLSRDKDRVDAVRTKLCQFLNNGRIKDGLGKPLTQPTQAMVKRWADRGGVRGDLAYEFVDETRHLLRKLVSSVQSVAGRENEVAQQRSYARNRVLAAKIAEELKPLWKKKADDAIEILGSSTPLWEDEEPEFDPEADELVMIDGDMIPIVGTYTGGYLPEVDTGGRSYLLAETREDAEEATTEYWHEMAINDRAEFVCMVGEQTILDWAQGVDAGPGTIQASSLSEWVTEVSEYPWEQWASYDGEEVEIKISVALADALEFDDAPVEDGWMTVLAYRSN